MKISANSILPYCYRGVGSFLILTCLNLEVSSRGILQYGTLENTSATLITSELPPTIPDQSTRYFYLLSVINVLKLSRLCHSERLRNLALGSLLLLTVLLLQLILLLRLLNLLQMLLNLLRVLRRLTLLRLTRGPSHRRQTRHPLF